MKIILMLSTTMIPLLLSSSFSLKRSAVASAFVVRQHQTHRVVTSKNCNVVGSRRRTNAIISSSTGTILPSSPFISSSSSCFYSQQQQQQQQQRQSSSLMTRMMMSTSSSSSSSSSTDTKASSSASTKTQQKTTSSSNKNNKQQQKQQKQKKKKQPNTGGLRKLPVVKRPNELMDRARKVPNRIKADSEIKNIRTRTRKQGAEKLNALSQALCLPLREIVDGYKREFRRLHPFEKVVADLTVRARQKKDGLTLSDLLNDIHEGRKAILEASKEWIYKVKNCDTAKESNQATIDGIQNLLNIYENLVYDSVNGICDLQSSLRSSPAIKLDTPAVVLVGAPNVGKSSIVREISSATPEVNNYPFTTRGMTLGHVEVFWSDDTTIAKAVVPTTGGGGNKKSGGVGIINQDVMLGKYAYSQLCQIMDSPGVLVRQEGISRNEMEQLTLAAMKHLPTAVMYVMDLSGQAGDKCSSVADQLQLRKEIRERFPRRPWIDVVSKYDLGVVDGSLEELEEILGPDTNYIKLSIHDGMGIDETRQEVLRMLGEVQLVLDAMSIVDDRTTTT